ncbi:hypothetical protein F4808DRAFT_406686, partial [Astrocystis sublimbata]
DEVLNTLELRHLLDRDVNLLSGGELQVSRPVLHKPVTYCHFPLLLAFLPSLLLLCFFHPQPGFPPYS